MRLFLATVLLSVHFLLSAFAIGSQLDSILQKNELRVGTTGDYLPFSFERGKSGAFEGMDVDMATSLAKSLGVRLRFVRTTWSQLMSDLLAGKFDIAMGGISINLERQKKAFFTVPYMVDGKSAISRCVDQNKFKKLSGIDHPKVRLIVNPGGTNEKFVRSRIKKAKIIVFPDNKTIFHEIAAKRADVMVTDTIETIRQAKIHKELCAVRTVSPFVYGEKGYLLPRGDLVWKAYVDQWLHLAVAKGEFAKYRKRWL